jgi:serine O-acetyltransferase
MPRTWAEKLLTMSYGAGEKRSIGEQMSLRRPVQASGVSIDETAPRPRAVRRRDMTWLQLYRSDIGRYKQYRPGVSLLNLLFTSQGLWALLEHRIASGVYNAALPPVIKRPCLYALETWQKAIEILTGISISCEACIGPGLYLGRRHIFISKDAIVGTHCSIGHGVTIGESGRGTQRGTPRVGDRVLILANAVLVGKLLVGDDAVIAPNSLVIYDVAEASVMMGVPAKCFRGSRDLFVHRLPDYPEGRELGAPDDMLPTPGTGAGPSV